MRTVSYTISKEDYEAYIDKPYNVQCELIHSVIPDYIFCGYGYYGGRLAKVKNEYKIIAEIGDSCD